MPPHLFALSKFWLYVFGMNRSLILMTYFYDVEAYYFEGDRCDLAFFLIF